MEKTAAVDSAVYAPVDGLAKRGNANRSKAVSAVISIRWVHAKQTHCTIATREPYLLTTVAHRKRRVASTRSRSQISASTNDGPTEMGLRKPNTSLDCDMSPLWHHVKQLTKTCTLTNCCIRRGSVYEVLFLRSQYCTSYEVTNT